MYRIALVVAVALTMSGVAHAQDPTCTLSSFEIRKVDYWTRGAAWNHEDYRCDNPGACRLSGWVVAPKTGTNLPGVVMAHGSNGMDWQDVQSLDEYCAISVRLLTAGYAVFWPLRRGVYDGTSNWVKNGQIDTASERSKRGVSSTFPIRVDPARIVGGRYDTTLSSGDPNFDYGGYFTNTGWSMPGWVTWQSNGDNSVDTVASLQLQYIQSEAVNEMNDALITFAAQQRDGKPLVNPGKIAVAGHSFGGAFATIAAAQHYSPIVPVAFASLSGAAMSWHESHWWGDYLESAAGNHTAIMFFQRVLDEADPQWSVDFDSEQWPFNNAVGHNGGAVIARYFTQVDPRLCTGEVAPPSLYYYCVHTRFVYVPTYVNVWFGAFQQFLDNHVRDITP